MHTQRVCDVCDCPPTNTGSAFYWFLLGVVCTVVCTAVLVITGLVVVRMCCRAVPNAETEVLEISLPHGATHGRFRVDQCVRFALPRSTQDALQAFVRGGQQLSFVVVQESGPPYGIKLSPEFFSGFTWNDSWPKDCVCRFQLRRHPVSSCQAAEVLAETRPFWVTVNADNVRIINLEASRVSPNRRLQCEITAVAA